MNTSFYPNVMYFPTSAIKQRFGKVAGWLTSIAQSTSNKIGVE